MTTSNVGGASSSAWSAAGSGLTVTVTSSPGSTVVNSTAGPRARSPEVSASWPGSVDGSVCGLHDVCHRATVVEVAVHRMREHRSGREPAVQVLELGPVGDEPRLHTLWIRRIVLRGLGGEADECGNGGGAGGERGTRRGHLLDVHPGCQVRRHCVLSQFRMCGLRDSPVGPSHRTVRCFPVRLTLLVSTGPDSNHSAWATVTRPRQRRRHNRPNLTVRAAPHEMRWAPTR